jgi:N-methylhydantoinase B
LFAVRCFLDPTIPMNEGCFRPIDLRLPPKTLVNPSPPHPGGGRNFVMCACIDAVIAALGSADPEREVAASGILQPVSMYPTRRGHNPWIHMSYELAGHGARRGSDGPDASGMHFGLARNTVPQVEPVEARAPFVIEAKEFIPDSGGAGQWRGGLGVRTVFRMLEDTTVTYRGDRLRFPPPGARGGGPGKGGAYYRRDAVGVITRLPNKASGIEFRAGDAIIVETSGGGGLGPATERSTAFVSRDLLAGRVTTESARAEYGVVLFDDGVVDEEATASKRASMTAAGVGATTGS